MNKNTVSGENAIGVFDSGLGGLTALRVIRSLLPGEHLIYFGDTGRVPYGTRSHETICRYADEDMRFLMTKNVKAVVVACGTVSANALGILRETYPVPVIGVIAPAAKRARAVTKNGRIGVIATPSTVASGAYEAALHAPDSSLTVISRACPLFVPLVENGFTNPLDPIPCLTAERYLAPFREDGIDTLILGCTHYPLLKEIIAKVLPCVTLIDTGVEVANALLDVLTENGLYAEKTSGGTTDYYVSDAPQSFNRLACGFLGTDTAPEGVRVEIERYRSSGTEL